jgi:5-methylcytosine-specific restriction endonuclease McrA
MNMAKNTQVSEDWQLSSKPTLHKEIVSENEIQDNNLLENSAEEIDSENIVESHIPLIDDETSLTIEEKNQLVNAVWYRCENPFCRFTQFITVHHIIEEKDGGTNKLDNLIVLCPYCHDLAHRKEIPEKEMRDWISNREERFKFTLEWHYR